MRFLLACRALLALSLFTAVSQAADRPARIGLLVTGPKPDEHACVRALRGGLADLGHVEGRTYVFDAAWSASNDDMPRMSTKLVQRRVDLVVTVTAQGLVEAKQELAAIPVVMAASSYPVERGLITSLSRPGGNITGIATFSGDVYAKRMQVLSETLPGLQRVAVLRMRGDMNDFIVRDLEAAARRFGLMLRILELGESDELAPAIEAAARDGAQALMTTQSTFFYRHAAFIAQAALRHRLPSFSGGPFAADAGMLITFGPDLVAGCYRSASFVDRILKGAKPADLPVEQPLKFELSVNLKTAKQLGVAVPGSILLRADKVIE